MKTVLLVLALIVFWAAPTLHAADEVLNSDEIIKEIFNNISEEYVTCTAYFSIASEAFRRSGDTKFAAEAEEVRNKAMQLALMTAKEGRTQEMAEQVTLARIELSTKSMTNEINNDISNIAILINNYAERCKEIMDDPDKVMKEWSAKTFKKHNVK